MGNFTLRKASLSVLLAVLIFVFAGFVAVAVSGQGNNCYTGEGTSNYCTTEADWQCGYYEANFKNDDVPEWCGADSTPAPTLTPEPTPTKPEPPIPEPHPLPFPNSPLA